MNNELNSAIEGMSATGEKASFFTLTNIMTIVVIGIIIYTAIYLYWVISQNMRIKKMNKNGVLLEIMVEKDTETKHISVEQMWAAFYHGLYIPWYRRLFRPQPYMSFEIKSENTQSDNKKEITFNFWVLEEYKDMIKQRLLGLYPKIQINEVKKDYMPTNDDDMRVVAIQQFGLREDNAFALKIFQDFEADPLTSITSAMSSLENKEVAVVQMLARPLDAKWRRKAERVLTKYEKTGKKPHKSPEWMIGIGSFFTFALRILDGLLMLLSPPSEGQFKVQKTKYDADSQIQMLEKIKRNPFAFELRILVGTPFGIDRAKEKVRDIAAAFKEIDGPHNQLRRNIIFNEKRAIRNAGNRFFNIINNNDIITSVEIAGFGHLPNKQNLTAGLKKIQSKRTEVPVEAAVENPFAIAMDMYGNERAIGLDQDGRMRHVYVSGMTGVGKSTLLENMIVRDIESGSGCVIIDPHGELVDVILEKISTDREDIFVLDPGDIAYPFGLNMLELSAKDELSREKEKVLVIDSYITTMKRVFGEASIGANTDDIFRMSCSAILDHPDGGGLLEMLLMITSDVYRARVIQYIKDPIVRDYWEVTFAALAGQGSFLVQNLNAPLNKLRRFIANGVVANIICQQKSTIDIAETMNSGGVILARFSRGDMGFENSALLGTMLISKIQIAAMQRVNIPQPQRVPTYLYVDEFQNFVGDAGGAKSFAEILSEARKYRLGLVIAHQFIEQLRQSGGNFLMEAIFNNCGTTITFRVGATDSKFYEQVYYDQDTDKGYKANDIANLGRGEVVMRVMTKTGLQSAPFIAKTFLPVQGSPRANGELIRERSRKLICKPRAEIVETIKTRMKMDTV